LKTYKVSRHPQSAAKVKDVVGLYLNPSEHAIVLSFDEKTSIQALERTQLSLPLRTGRATRHTHDYKRHGVVQDWAAARPTIPFGQMPLYQEGNLVIPHSHAIYRYWRASTSLGGVRLCHSPRRRSALTSIAARPRHQRGPRY
jgi:hypothetical protein